MQRLADLLRRGSFIKNAAASPEALSYYNNQLANVHNLPASLQSAEGARLRKLLHAASGTGPFVPATTSFWKGTSASNYLPPGGNTGAMPASIPMGATAPQRLYARTPVDAPAITPEVHAILSKPTPEARLRALNSMPVVSQAADPFSATGVYKPSARIRAPEPVFNPGRPVDPLFSRLLDPLPKGRAGQALGGLAGRVAPKSGALARFAEWAARTPMGLARFVR